MNLMKFQEKRYNYIGRIGDSFGGRSRISERGARNPNRVALIYYLTKSLPKTA